MRKNVVLMKIVVVAIVFALMVVPVQAQEGPVSYGGVEFPLGDVSFADGVVSFNPGKDTVSPYNNPQSAIGTPNGCGENAVALGHGGVLTVKFTNNYLIDVEGADLYVFECGGAVEPFKVDISKDGSSWINLGTVSGQPRSIDIHGKVAPGDKFSYVRLTDAGGGSGHPYAGADITAVGAIGAEERPDSDGDGVPDDIDECPHTPAGVAVDDRGCPVAEGCDILRSKLEEQEKELQKYKKILESQKKTLRKAEEEIGKIMLEKSGFGSLSWDPTSDPEWQIATKNIPPGPSVRELYDSTLRWNRLDKTKERLTQNIRAAEDYIKNIEVKISNTKRELKLCLEREATVGGAGRERRTAE